MIKNEIGNRYGRLTVVERVENSKCRNARFVCKCDCGGSTVVRGGDLRRNQSQSCGCLQKQLVSELMTTHGKTKSVEFTTWQSMLARCSNPNHKNFARYGGRGINVCPEWQSFENFIADMGTRPSPKHSLDRVDNDAGYSPENCRWVGKVEQARNRSTNRWLTYNNETKSLAEWVEILGINYHALQARLNRGWDTERALTTPVHKAGATK